MLKSDICIKIVILCVISAFLIYQLNLEYANLILIFPAIIGAFSLFFIAMQLNRG